tara:strand:- start:769 stop:951 length:183 start_codon:yes stop_codon:yes gene_type:complete
MMRCVTDRCREGRLPCPTPELCDAEQFHIADPAPARSIWPTLAAALALVGVALALSFAFS